MKKTILFIFYIFCILGCKKIDRNINLKIYYDSENKTVTIENLITSHKYGFNNSLYLNLYGNNLEPVYYIDSLNKLLYIYDLGYEIRKYNLKNDSLINRVEILYREPERHNIKLLKYKNYLVLKSNWRCDISDTEFKSKISLFDTLYHNEPICYRYTLDLIPKIKKDILYLTAIYHGGSVDTLIHKSDYIYDLKKKEFITHLEPCKKVLSNGNP